MNRPFYTKFAWAYDFLIQGPAKERIDFIVTQLHQQRITDIASVLDAGCGTGTYAIALAERGFRLTGVDASADLIAEARRKTTKTGVRVDFIVGDVLRLSEKFVVDAILCRGVLNDLTEAKSRRSVFFSFAGVIRRGGVLILDVREWHSTVVRKTENPIFERSVLTEKGRLNFRSVTKLKPETHTLSISETHILESSRGRDIASFDFEMKCWTQNELADHLVSAGFKAIDYFGDYDSTKPVGSTDRVIAIAMLNNS